MKVDTSWSKWTNWGDCSKTCLPQGDPNPGTQRRTRQCREAKNGGLACSQLTGGYHEDQNCNLNCCPKDGEWMSWSRYSKCSKECGNENEEPGQFSRTRSCLPLQCGGKACEGANEQNGECNGFDSKPCPINGNWGSAWLGRECGLLALCG